MIIFFPIALIWPCVVSRELAQLLRRYANHLPKPLPTRMGLKHLKQLKKLHVTFDGGTGMVRFTQDKKQS